MTDGTRIVVAFFISFALHWLFLHDWQPPEKVSTVIDGTIFVDIASANVGVSLEAPMTLEQAPMTSGTQDMSADRRRAALKNYLDKVSRSVHQHRQKTKSKKLIGNALFRVLISTHGDFIEITQIRSSGDEQLDADAYNAIKAASGRVPRPHILGLGPLSILLAVKYQFDL